MKNVEAVLRAAGPRFAEVVKTTIFLTDMNDFAAVNAVYGESFADTPPARSTVAVAALPRGSRVEVEVVALVRLSRVIGVEDRSRRGGVRDIRFVARRGAPVFAPRELALSLSRRRFRRADSAGARRPARGSSP